MTADRPVDYLALHRCDDCRAKHRLMSYPVTDGWIVATVCDCREKGLPKRYSTESEPLASFDAAEVAISWLLHPPRIKDTVEHAKNVFWHNASNKWTVRIKRNKVAYTVGYFTDHAAAIKARDEFLAEELEAA